MEEFTTASQRVYQELRNKIVYGELKPGERLVHRKLAKEFGTSNIPVVEAIGKLERDTLVEHIPGLGARVRIWSLKDIIELLLIREILEATAIRIYTLKSTPRQREMLEEYGRQFKDAVRAKDNNAIIKADAAIHMHIVKCTEMLMLYRFIDNSSLINATIRRDTKRIHTDIDYSSLLNSHDELIEAANGRDPDKAEKAVRTMLRKTIENIVRNECQNDEEAYAYLNNI